MKRLRAAGVLFLAIVAAAVIGCQESTSDEPSGPTLETHQPGDLPALDEPLPTLLDDDRLEVAAPKQWHIASQSSKCLTRFQVSRERKYPSIILTAEEYAGDVFDVNEENVVQFAKQRTAEMQADTSASRQKMTLTPIKVGSFVGVSYQRRGKLKAQYQTIILERLMLETVAFGRLYTVELRAREGEENEYRPHLLAVAGGLKFSNPEEQKPDQTEPDADDTDVPPDDSPGEEEENDTEAKPEDEEEKPELEADEELN